MKLAIDRKIYDDATISKTIYWLSSEFTFQRQLDGEVEHITITPKLCVGTSDQDIEVAFFDKLNDFKLRGIIANETCDIRTILYAKAFADDEDLSIEDLAE